MYLFMILKVRISEIKTEKPSVIHIYLERTLEPRQCENREKYLISPQI